MDIAAGLVVSVMIFFAIPLYLLFKDSMNLFQKVGRLYWITRNDLPNQPIVAKAFLKQVPHGNQEGPFWYGRGVQVRFMKWTFQVGWLQGQNDSLEQQISSIGWLPDVDPKVFRTEDQWADDLARKQ